MNLSKGKMIENHKILNNYYATVCMCISTVPTYLSVNVFKQKCISVFLCLIECFFASHTLHELHNIAAMQ